MTTVPPCCAETAEPPCPQHRQAARVDGRQGLRVRSGRPTAVIGAPGKVQPAQPEEQP